MTDLNETANVVVGITQGWREHLAEGGPRSARSPTTTPAQATSWIR